MNAMRFSLVIAIFLVASCREAGSADTKTLCGDMDIDQVCSIPFEAMYANRELLNGRNVRLDGVLVVGIDPEPPGSRRQLMLLFPSTERAQICNQSHAIEVEASSAEIADALRETDKDIVSLSGRLKPSLDGKWAVLEVRSGPSVLSLQKSEITCLATPPPPPPE